MSGDSARRFQLGGATDAVSRTRPGSAWTQLAGERRLFALMYALVPGAIGAGLVTYAQLAYALEVFGDESGFAKLATTFTVGVALAGFPAGAWVDRFGARHLSAVALGLNAMVNAFIGAMLVLGAATPLALLVAKFGEGFTVGIAFASLPAVRASLVRHEALGAADILNTLRHGVGVLVGTAIASAGLRSAAAMVAGAVLMLLSTFAFVRVTNSPQTLPGPRAPAEVSGLVAQIRRLPALRAAATADLLWSLVRPTQLTALMIVDYAAYHTARPLLLLGACASVLGTAWLSVSRAQETPSRSMLSYVGATAATLFAAALLLLDERLLSMPIILYGLKVLGAFSVACVQALLGALVQQGTPDALRARVAGLLGTARSSLTAVASAVASLVITRYSTQVMLWVLLAGLSLFVLSTRGFRALGIEPAFEREVS